MPAKSKRKKGKFSPQRRPQGQPAVRPAATPPTQAQSTQSQIVQSTQTQPTQTRPAAPAAQPAFRPKGGQSTPSTAMPATYLRLGSELKTIAIITGSLVVVLIILSFVLH